MYIFIEEIVYRQRCPPIGIASIQGSNFHPALLETNRQWILTPGLHRVKFKKCTNPGRQLYACIVHSILKLTFSYTQENQGSLILSFFFTLSCLNRLKWSVFLTVAAYFLRNYLCTWLSSMVVHWLPRSDYNRKLIHHWNLSFSQAFVIIYSTCRHFQKQVYF